MNVFLSPLNPTVRRIFLSTALALNSEERQASPPPNTNELCFHRDVNLGFPFWR